MSIMLHNKYKYLCMIQIVNISTKNYYANPQRKSNSISCFKFILIVLLIGNFKNFLYRNWEIIVKNGNEVENKVLWNRFE